MSELQLRQRLSLRYASAEADASIRAGRHALCGRGPGEIRTHDLCLRRAALLRFQAAALWSE